MNRALSITIDRHVDRDAVEPFLDLYRQSFAPLATRSAIRQWFTDDEFRHEMASDAVVKFIGRDEHGRPCALATLATDLATLPWLNPTYYRHHFPDHYERGAIYYISALLVRPDLQGGPWVRAMLHEIAGFILNNRGMTAFDCCDYNVSEVGLPDLVTAIAREVARVQIDEIDCQHYYAVELSEMAEDVIDLRDQPAAFHDEPELAHRTADS